MMEAIAAVVLIFGLISTGQIIHKANISAKIRKRIQSSAVPTPNKEIPPFSPSQEIKPYQLPPLQTRTSTKMAMGLRRLDQANWLTIDSNYLPEHHLRKIFLATCRPKVIQCLLGSEAACHEVLGKVTKFLTGRFPQSFTLRNTSSGPVVDNHITGETFPVGTQCPNPLETAALLAMEDFNVLIRNPETGEYHLQASATLFPAGWKLQERIGTTMANLHGPVPGWQEKMGAHVNRYFDHLSSKTCMERNNLFIQTTPDYFQDSPEEIPMEKEPRPEDITVRRERQTFTRLEKSGAVLFAVRTFMMPLTTLGKDQLRGLTSQINGWEEEIKMYKGWGLWGPPVERWCQSVIRSEEGGVEGETKELACEA